jgi:hypothetical protein
MAGREGAGLPSGPIRAVSHLIIDRRKERSMRLGATTVVAPTRLFFRHLERNFRSMSARINLADEFVIPGIRGESGGILRAENLTSLTVTRQDREGDEGSPSRHPSLNKRTSAFASLIEIHLTKYNPL